MRRADAAMQVFASAFQDGPKGKKAMTAKSHIRVIFFRTALTGNLSSPRV